MTWGDLIRKYKPEATDEEVEFILWERTAYPMAPSEYVIKQIEAFFKMEETNNDEVLNLLCKKVTRLEVINKQGRQLVKYLNEGQSFEFSLQDDNRTLKIFVVDSVKSDRGRE